MSGVGVRGIKPSIPRDYLVGGGNLGLLVLLKGVYEMYLFFL